MYTEHFILIDNELSSCITEIFLWIFSFVTHTYILLFTCTSFSPIILAVSPSAFHDSRLTEPLSFSALPPLRVSSRAPSLLVAVLDPPFPPCCVLPSSSSPIISRLTLLLHQLHHPIVSFSYSASHNFRACYRITFSS
ncbi:hypothetical protein BDW68DRAFT_159901 [Aspergillus falconensis]